MLSNTHIIMNFAPMMWSNAHKKPLLTVFWNLEVWLPRKGYAYKKFELPPNVPPSYKWHPKGHTQPIKFENGP